MLSNPPSLVQLDFFASTPPESFQTTAIYPNRLRDKRRVEHKHGLPEHGNVHTVFHTPRGTEFARGYVRVVYGDHGPYVEFLPDQVGHALLPKFSRPAPAEAYYEWLLPADGSNMKVYRQLRDVRNLRNPPAGGFRGDRAEGYADYRPGRLYVSPWELQLAPPRAP